MEHPAMRHILTYFAVVALPGVASAQGFVESIHPPVVAVGKTTRVTLVGHDFGPGLDVWTALPKGTLTAKPVSSEPGKLVFDLSVAANAPVGVAGLRIATRDGLTNAALFHLEDLPVTGNIARETAVPLSLPACVWGTFKEGTLDRYTITVAAGERVCMEAIANRLGKDADPLLTIRDADGRFVAEKDNDPGLYFDFRFSHVFEKAGTYTLEVRDARLRASEHNHYILRVGKFPTERVAVRATGFNPLVLQDHGDSSASPRGTLVFANTKRPGDHGSAWFPVTTSEGAITVAREFDEPRDSALLLATSPAAQLAILMTPMKANVFQPLDRTLTVGRLQATPAQVPGSLCGVLRKPGQRQAFAIKLEKGQRIVLRAESNAINSPADLEIMVTDRFGKEQRRAADGPNGAEATLDFTAPVQGEYGIIVRDVLRDGSDSHAYCIRVRSDSSPPTLTAEVEGLTIPQGDHQTVPILVTRTGTNGPIKLALAGNPTGLKLTPTEIPATANSVVCKLEAASNTPLGTHTIQIVAEYDRAPQVQRMPGGSFYSLHAVTEREKVAVRIRPLIDKKYHNVDLIPIALREDQTRLPPSLTDRFAVQITPPSPFTFSLPEETITLPRYQTAPIPVVTTRIAEFDGPISFRAIGGQLGDKTEGRTRVYAEFPDATAKQPSIAGVGVSKILSNIAKARIDVTATGVHQGRKVTLTRTFELDLVSAYRFPPESAVKLSLLPGESAKVKLTVSRLKNFDAPITLHLSPMQGMEFPETLTIAKGQTTVEFMAKAGTDAQPRKQNLNINASAEVSGFEEELRASPVEIEIKKVEVPKKK
ncbi:MAG: hypothetical protein C0467_03810 [Planctomycetaceae bacterium]|nr:hypothetical protein [Planctomycetaceae bacterium]